MPRSPPCAPPRSASRRCSSPPPRTRRGCVQRRVLASRFSTFASSGATGRRSMRCWRECLRHVTPQSAERRAAPIGWTYRIEAWCATLAFSGFGLLPLDRASALGGAIARRIGPHLGVTKRARLNLRAAMPALSEVEIEAIIRGMWDNVGRVAAEYPHLRKIKVFEPGGRVETRGLEHLDRSLAAGRRVVLFSGHLGNWEIAALAGGQYGLDIAHIYRAANNPLFDRLIGRL